MGRKRTRIRYTCEVCGEPILRRGSIHVRCKTLGGRDRGHTSQLTISLEQTIYKLRQELDASVKRWNANMGRKRLEEMFPDMVDRVGKKEKMK